MKKYLVIFFLIANAASFSQVHLSQGLMAYYPFNGNANDASGNGNNPVFNNATLAADRFGNAGKAYSFNGVDNYIRIPNSPTLNPSTAISICAWVKVKDFYTGPCRGNSILMKGITEDAPAYKLRLDENHYPGNYSCGPSVDLTHEYFYGQGFGNYQDNNLDWVQKDQWNSVVYTYDGSTAKLYLNCILKMSVDVTGLSMTNGEDLFIGSTDLPFYPYWFNGVIDEVRIYNRAINPTEVMAYGGCCTIVNSQEHDPAPVCAPASIDITMPAIMAGSDPRLTFTYFSDQDVTVPVNNPTAVSVSGLYYIKGTATNLCTTVDTVRVTILDAPATPQVTLTQPTCNVSTGTIQVNTPTPGDGIYFSIDQTNYFNTTGIFTVPPGNYTVSVKNNNGCYSPVTSVVINAQPLTPPAPIVTVINNCDGTSTLSTTATGTLLWSNNAVTQSIIVNESGVYTVTQTANGCTSQPGSGTALPKTIPPTPEVTVVNNCNGTSTLSTTATGTLLWSNNATTSSITVNTAGSYTVTQTVNGCTSLGGSGTASPKSNPAAPIVTVVNNCDGTSTLSTNAAGSLLWSNNETTPVITVTTAGIYSVTQTVNGCTGPAGSGTAQPKSIPAVPLVNVVNNCDGTSTLSTTATGTLLWSNNASTLSITVNAAGTFSVTQTVNGCTSQPGSGTADPKIPMTGTAVAPDIACGQTTGAITVSTLNGIAPFNYSINGGVSWQSSNIFSNLSAGNYAVKVKDGGNCMVDVAVTIKQLNSNINATLITTDIPCGQASGSITVNASNGSAPYSFSIDGGSTWQSSNVFSNLSAGNYNVRIKDAGNCLLDVSASVKQLSSNITATLIATDIPCGQTTGSISVNASNGSAPYIYSIDAGNTWQSSNVFPNLSAGYYMVRIKDAGNCITDLATTLKQNISAITASASAADIPCGQVSGIITVTATNGNAPYNYSIDNGTNWQSSNIFSNLNAGNYSIRIKDAGGCLFDIAAEIKQLNSTITATVNTVDNPCGQSAGKITVNAANGNAPYNYSIDNGTNWQSSNIFSNLNAGNYSIRIKDAGGCLFDIAAEIKQLNSTITATVNTVDNPCGQSAGKITVNAANGNAPYNYSIDNGTSWQPSNIFSNLSAGNYSIRIKDAGGCLFDIAAEIKQLNSTITATLNTVDNACGQAAGKITVNAANGNAPYNYSIDNGTSWQSSNIFSNLSAGNYSIRIKDAGGCLFDIAAEIKQLNSTITATLNTVDNPCGQSAGKITVNAANGNAPYNYSIDNGTSWQSSNIFSNLSAGNYSIRIKDAGGCLFDIAAEIKQLNSNLTATVNTVDNPCGQPAGKITINADNGIAPYNYSIDNGTSWQSSNIFSNLSAGNYSIRIKDAGGCLFDIAAEVNQLNSNLTATVNTVDNPCGQPAGKITVNAANGIAPYNYSLDNGNNWQSSNVFSNLSAGNYSIKIKDAGGCMLTVSAEVKQLNSTLTATVNTVDNPCGQPAGKITVNADNGIAPYNYSLDNGNNWQSSNVFSNLSAGNYSIRIKDAGGCLFDISAEIKQLNSTLTATVNTVDNPCGQPVGKITVNAANGIAPYNYSIDNGTSWQTSNIFSNLTAGNYSLKIKDAGGCMLDVSAEIKQLNSTLTATVNSVDNPCGQPAGKITVNAANGIAPYNYSIDNGTSWQTSNIFSNLAAGNYSVKIKDAGGCMLDVSAEIKQLNSTLTATVNTVDNPCGQSAGKITVNAANGIAPYNYSIDNGASWQSSNIFTNLSAGNYSIKIKDAGGCVLDISASIQQLNAAITASVTVTDVSCSQPSGSVLINAANGVAPYNYSRDAGTTWQSSNVFSNLPAGNYVIRIRDAGGCTLDITATIKQTGSPITVALNASDITCIQKSGTITVSAANGISPYGYSINGGTTYQASNVFNNLLATNYVVRVRDALGCFLDTGVTVKQNNAPPDIRITNPSRVCEPGTVNLTLPSVTAGSETGLTYSYFTDASLNTQVVNPGAVKTGGIYYIQAVKANGCVDAKPVTVTIPPKSIFKVSPDGSICNNDPVQLKASGGTSYLWLPSNANIPEPVVKPAVTTTYTVKIKDSVCNDSTVLTTTIKVLSLPTIKATKSNDVDCANDFSQLNATGAKRYTWQPFLTLNNPNISNPIAHPVNKTLYTVTGYDSSGCRNTDTITVNVDMNAMNKSGYSMPTAFTPNNDGLNDCFGLKYWGAVSKLSFSIYNRFGERIFYTTDPARACWDGRYKGVMQEVGAYVYFIQATTPCELVSRKGTVMILR